ncbi:hypothetical protein [Protaetiibacter larvae]|uniref:Histidine kinase n=1 Tax=Protaetiibacter larvae TaxID=2592654 RepID=A0A5C1Y5R6_9MICO|nr:hypothetical protein [Protaetiibacter larvae]QEO08649.1 hypothetical protein FLP23_00560 [Protaetiibacter larvae]
MKIGVPRALIVALAALFSAYHLLLAAYSLPFHYVSEPGPVIAAMLLYALVTATLLWPTREPRLPIWMAAFALGVAVALPPLITTVLDPARPGGNGYATWYVAAIGTLMTITAVRLRPGFAWAGIAFLAVQTVFWSGPGALGSIGVIGSASWVGVAHIITNTLAKASRDSDRFSQAEREATEWQAAQEAHLNERQFRLGQTSVMALPMLRTIRSSHGELTASQRAECLHLEAGIRDEIRGRKLLNDVVREQVMLARRRGTVVTLLDEGGIDELADADLDRVLGRLALALRETTADRLIARTVPEGSEVAVTVVGLKTVDDESVTMLGGEPDDEVELWLEIPRQAAHAPEG